jgi:glutamate racemase
MNPNQNPIGVFDSGVGGTSVWKEIVKLLPHEKTIYLADSKNAPYGIKSRDEIIALSEKNTEFLLNRNCKIIVVACNTATTNAIAHLRAKYNVPFIGIEPAIKPAALHTKTNSIGILATKGTLSSELFAKTSDKFAQDVQVIEQVGTGLVELIEANQLNSDETYHLLQTYLHPMIEKEIDYLILGCTHYPYLIPQIQKILPDKVTIIDSGEAVARQTKNVLDQSNLLNLSKKIPIHEIYSNTDITTLSAIIGNNKIKKGVRILDF